MITTDCLQVLCSHLDLHTILSLLWTSQAIRSQIREIQPRIHDYVSFTLHEPSPSSLWKYVQLQSTSIRILDYANCGVWSPDALLMAFACYNVIYVWSQVTNQLVSTLTGHCDDIQTLAWSSDGLRLASCSNDHTILIWSGSSIKHILCEHSQTVWSIAFSADNTRLVSGSNDGKVCIWDMTTGLLIQVWQKADTPVHLVSISSDGVLVAIATNECTSYLWETLTSVTHTLPRHDAWLSSLTFSPDETQLVLGYDDGLVRIYNVHTLSLAVFIDSGPSWYRSTCLIAFSPNGSQIIRRFGDITIFNAATGTRLKTLDNYEGKCVLALQWSQHCISVITTKRKKIQLTHHK